ncbi:hypothetical protein ICG_06036 [Bacillus cereus BAG1X1-3]|nr:hypothetical protein ICG_06036 [Bacillus cereus BAG1X1-3]
MYLAIGIGIIILILVVTGYFTYKAFKDNYVIKYFSLFMFIFIIFVSLYMLFILIKASL